MVDPENEFVTVKVRTPLRNFGGQEVEKIPKEEAICRFCFNEFQANMLKTNCKCKFALLHESCAIEWSHKKGNNKCDVCEQDIQNIPVTVSRENFSSAPRTRNKELQRGSTPKRFWSYCCFSL
ncbi:hypothetical protein Pfo_026678 [Paulownia fortunei]|nr:hypothetical protein Pfo_026678 [Paulownia fortunei]